MRSERRGAEVNDPHPIVVVLAGPNGAGKSTVAPAFLWLPSPEFALERVADRVRAGGHDVPEDTVRRRYRAGLRNFFSLYEPLATSWGLYDSSGPEPRLVAERLETLPPRVYDESVWAAVKRQGTA